MPLGGSRAVGADEKGKGATSYEDNQTKTWRAQGESLLS